uniref:NB-ARC domain-containing protein n=1 Tax=Oryza punctata TaxID=4537 RepID=A0A0E0M583_ORYPU
MASTAFPSLKKIKLHRLEGLERLADIENYQKLSRLPEAPKLEIFTLNENNRAVLVVTSIQMHSLEIMECDKLIGRSTLVKSEPTCCARDQLLPRLTSLSIQCCGGLREFFVLPPSLTDTTLVDCSNLEFIWGKGDIDSDSLLQETGVTGLFGDLPSLESLHLVRCKLLASLPCGPESYSSLLRITIAYCQALNMKPLYKRLRTRSDSIWERYLSHARARRHEEGTSPLLGH